MRLLVNAPSGLQEIVTVGEGGAYFDTSRVLWDERTDGTLPDITLGGMVRDGVDLVFDLSRMNQHLAVLEPQTQAATQSAIVAATQLRLDSFAQTRNYDGILSACTYATSGVTKFAAEGQYCVDARDATWSALYTIMGEVLAQTRPMPESFADVAPLLPALAWPA